MLWKRTLPPSIGRIGRRFNTPQPALTKTIVFTSGLHADASSKISPKGGPPRALTSAIVPSPIAIPVNGPARLIAIRFAVESAPAAPALHDVSPPNPMRSICGVSPNDRPTSACPSSWRSTPTSTTTIHCTSPARSPGRNPRNATTRRNDPWMRTGIEPSLNARFMVG